MKRASGGSPSSSLPYAHQLPHADVISFHFLFCLLRLRCLYSYTRGTMKTTTTVSLIRLAAALLLVVSAATFTCVSATHIDAERMALERRYTTAHSLGDNYVFDPRDGWETVNTTNLAYKYNYPRSDALSESALDDDDDDYLDDTENGDYSNSTLVPRAKKTSHAKTKKKAAKASKTNECVPLFAIWYRRILTAKSLCSPPETVVRKNHHRSSRITSLSLIFNPRRRRRKLRSHGPPSAFTFLSHARPPRVS